MFDVAPTELMLVALVALLVIGPKDLPRVMRVVGQWIARVRGMARHFRSGMDEMIRQAEVEEMERKWTDENARIMREHPPMREEGAPQATPLSDDPQPDDGAPSAEPQGPASVTVDPTPWAEVPSAPSSDIAPASDLPAQPSPSHQAELPLGPTADRPA